uniref:Cas system-associated protein n=1 Tax=Podoviridae sp. ctlSr7 TaxID=2826573 RepID=A0A8S5MXM7_9CAUD|nr:MAG TPA: Cas system-associated protein [Podoviridae sp. ctlSr7]
MVYMITYDLNSTGQRYSELISAIKGASNGCWCTYWKSSYLIQSPLSPSQIADRLKPYLDSNDRLIVIEVKRNYEGWLTDDEWSYINDMF